MQPVAMVPAVVAALVGAATAWAVHVAVTGSRSAVVASRLAGDGAPGGPPGWFRQALASSGLTADPHRAWAVFVRSGTAAVALVGWRWPQLMVAGVVSALVVVRARRRTRARREHRTYDAALVAAIDGLVSRLATGTSLAVALHEAAAQPSPVGSDLAVVVRRHRHGQQLQSAIDCWAAERATPGVTLLADALAIAGRSGGSQRGALLGVQATLRDRESLGREVRALASQARTSGIVLAVTPAGFAAVVAVVDPRVAAFFSTPAGWACLIGGAALDATGALWMHRLTEAHS